MCIEINCIEFFYLSSSSLFRCIFISTEIKTFPPNHCAPYCAGTRARPRDEFFSCNRKQKSVSGTRASPLDRASPPHVIRP